MVFTIIIDFQPLLRFGLGFGVSFAVERGHGMRVGLVLSFVAAHSKGVPIMKLIEHSIAARSKHSVGLVLSREISPELCSWLFCGVIAS